MKKMSGKVCAAALIGGMVLLFSACKFGFHEMFWRDNPVDQRSTALKNIEIDVSSPLPDQYDCLLIADTHFGHKDYSVPQKAFFESLEDLKNRYIADPLGPQLKFCIILGDVVDHGTADEYKAFAAFQQSIKNAFPKIQLFNVVGNHDLYNSGWNLWKDTCYPHTSAFYFETAKLGWYFVDTASGTLGRPQFYDLKAKLHQSDRPKFIFTHYPLYGNNIFYFSLSNPRERAELISLFAKTKTLLYCSGHYHAGAYYNYGPFEEYSTPALGQYASYQILHVDETKPSFRITTVHLN